jgi:hypothetical protein
MTGKLRWNAVVRLFVFVFSSVVAASAVFAGPRSFELLPTDQSGPHLFGEGVISTPGN